MQKKFCGTCGTKLKPEDKFCSKCGKLINNTQHKETNTDTPVTPYPTPETTPTKTDAQHTSENVTPQKESEQKPVKQAIPQSQKKLLTDKEIKEHIKAGTTFLSAIAMTIVGIVCFALTTAHGGFLLIGIMFVVAAVWKFISTARKIKQRKSYTLVLRECLVKKIQEYDEGSDDHLLYFTGYNDGIGCLVAKVSKNEFDKTEIGDLYYLAVSRCKDSTYDVAAYFKESEWRLEGSK